MENRPSFKIVNLGTYFSIFYNFRNLATFSHHFWIIQLTLQPLITNGIIAMLKMKSALCGVTPCNDIYEMYQFCMFNWSFALIDIGKMFSILIKSLVQGCIGDIHEKKYIELWSSTFLESINFQVWFTINTRYNFLSFVFKDVLV